MALPADTQDDILDDPIDDDPASGSYPDDDDAPPVESEAPETSDDDGPDLSDPDAESEEWDSLEKKFDNIEDEQERRRAIGKQYWEKTRYASKVRKENEELHAEVNRLQATRVEEDRREQQPQEPAPPHPDLERLDSRINALAEKDSGFFESQQKALISISEVDQQIAVVKDKVGDADEYQRAVLEQRLEHLETRKGNLHDRFLDLKDKREDLEYRLDELGQQREWTAGLLDQQGKDVERERQSREHFKLEFPQQVARSIEALADEAGIAEDDDDLRDDLKQTVKDRLTVKFWKLGQSQEVDDVDVDELIQDEVGRYLKGHDLAGRANFGKRSKEKLSVSGRRPAPTPPKKPARGASPRPPAGYDAEPKDVTALGTVDQSPTMARGRKYLDRRGL